MIKKVIFPVLTRVFKFRTLQVNADIYYEK